MRKITIRFRIESCGDYSPMHSLNTHNIFGPLFFLLRLLHAPPSPYLPGVSQLVSGASSSKSSLSSSCCCSKRLCCSSVIWLLMQIACNKKQLIQIIILVRIIMCVRGKLAWRENANSRLRVREMRTLNPRIDWGSLAWAEMATEIGNMVPCVFCLAVWFCRVCLAVCVLPCVLEETTPTRHSTVRCGSRLYCRWKRIG